MGALCMWMCVCVSCCLDSRSRFAQRLLNLSNANLNQEQRTLQHSRWRRTCDQENPHVSWYFLFWYWYQSTLKFWKQIARVISQPRMGKWETRVLSCIRKNCVICVVIRTFKWQSTAKSKTLHTFWWVTYNKPPGRHIWGMGTVCACCSNLVYHKFLQGNSSLFSPTYSSILHPT